MSISSRGHNNTLVLDSCTVPVTEMFESLINFRNLEEITKRYPVNVDEIFECVDACLDISPLTDDDFINFECVALPSDDEQEDQEFNLTTLGLSDHVFISIISHARLFYPDLEDIDTLYTDGLYLILAECIYDLYMGEEHFRSSELHNIVYEGFKRAFPSDIMNSIQELAKKFNLVVEKEKHEHN